MIKRFFGWLFGTKGEKGMVTFDELQKVSDPMTGDDVKKAKAYLKKINVFRAECDIPMVATSFFRSVEHQIEIYRRKAKNKQSPFANGKFDMTKVPLKSKHLFCEACDFADVDKKLAEWVKGHLDWCAANGFYFEDFEATPSWIHIQITPPKSGKTVFKP